MERGSWKPNVEISPSCPRCGSSNTKFCYYNNYSLTQPRYFCKGCRRYWTKGGSLRNVPVGGGCRKNRRSKSLRLSSSPNSALHNKNYGYGGVMIAYNKGIVSPSIDQSSSSSSSVVPDGSHIDLALVYANFLNPQQDNSKNTDTNHRFEMPDQLPSEFDSSLEPFTTTLEPSNVVQLPQRHAGLVGCFTTTFEDHLSIDHHHDHQVGLNNMDDHQLFYYSGLDSSSTQHKHQDMIFYDHQQCSDDNDKRNPTGLPPLPGEEMLPNSDHIAGLHEPHVFETETDQDPNVLFGNWSPFDLSSTDDDTFSKST